MPFSEHDQNRKKVHIFSFSRTAYFFIIEFYCELEHENKVSCPCLELSASFKINTFRYQSNDIVMSISIEELKAFT